MRIGLYQFQPNLLASIIVIIGLFLLVRLGNWQLIRAEEKKNILANIDIRKNSKPLDIESLEPIDDKNFYRLKVTGKFDAEHQLLLDNRFYKGRVGFEVIQPFIVEQQVILVNRGWIPLPIDRNNLPDIPTPDGELTLIGEVNIPTQAYVLKEDELSTTNAWPQLIQAIDLSLLDKLYDDLGMNIEPWIFRQDPDDNPFFQRLWIAVNMSPERHISYAVTWFGLALALIIIYIVAVTSREES